jgi:hypothetical protein
MGTLTTVHTKILRMAAIAESCLSSCDESQTAEMTCLFVGAAGGIGLLLAEVCRNSR